MATLIPLELYDSLGKRGPLGTVRDKTKIGEQLFALWEVIDFREIPPA